MKNFWNVSAWVFLFYFIALHFRFWGTYEEHAGLLHRYIHSIVVCCLHPQHLYLAFLPVLSFPNSLPLAVPPLVLPNRPNVWCSHPCVHVFSLSIPNYEHVVFDFLFLCQFADNDGFQIHPCPYKGHKLIRFLWLHSIPWWIDATFSVSTLSLMGIWVGSRSLLL